MVAVPAQWWCLLAFMLQAESSCLDGAVPEQALKALAELTTGQSYPIGIWVNDWAASHLAATVAQIVIQETLGYNTTLKGPGPLALDGFYALPFDMGM
eukprot:s1772_g12.t1